MERWMKIDRFTNYMVSSEGRVKNTRTQKILAQSISSYGHPVVCLRKPYGVDRKSVKNVGRLVADAFYDGDHEGLYVKHIDGDLTNNRLANLKFVTMAELKKSKK